MTVVILGGGIGGLSSAYYLLKSTKYKVILIEASNRLGGWIRSEKHPTGLVLEAGPRTLRPRGEAGLNTLNLIDDLNLSGALRPIPSTHPAAKNRFVYANGKLYTLPSNLFSIFRKTPPFTKPLVAAFLHDLKAKPKYVADDSIYDFVARRFGKEIADYAISPLICGICGGDAKRISVNFLLNNFFEKEQKHGSVLRGSLMSWSWKRKKFELSDTVKKAKVEKWSSYSFRDGLESLPLALSARIQENGGTIMKNTEPSKIDFRKKFLIVNEKEIPFKYLISAISAHSLAKLVQHDHYHNITKPLLKIPYTTIITVNLVYKKKVLDIDGFGFLAPPAENLPILGKVTVCLKRKMRTPLKTHQKRTHQNNKRKSQFKNFQKTTHQNNKQKSQFKNYQRGHIRITNKNYDSKTKRESPSKLDY